MIVVISSVLIYPVITIIIRAERETPSVIGIVMNAISVSDRTCIIMVSIPRIIRVAGAVIDATSIDVTILITWEIPYVDGLGRMIKNDHVFDVIDGIFWGNCHDL